jgi:hypothetical protein
MRDALRCRDLSSSRAVQRILLVVERLNVASRAVTSRNGRLRCAREALHLRSIAASLVVASRTAWCFELAIDLALRGFIKRRKRVD